LYELSIASSGSVPGRVFCLFKNIKFVDGVKWVNIDFIKNMV